MAMFYRFRPLSRLLCSGELRRQEIYFADPKQLNDPMEGFRDMYWKGDEVVWQNLFRHYFLCLDWAFSLLILSSEDQRFGWNNIPLESHGNLSLTPQHQARLDQAVEAFCNEELVRTLAKSLAVRSAPVRRNELVSHLRSLHPLAVASIHNNYLQHGLLPGKKPDLPKMMEKLAKAGAGPLNERLDHIKRIESGNKNSDEIIDALFYADNTVSNELNFINLYNEYFDPSRHNKNFVFLDFPDQYSKQIERLVYPEWYTACFMSDCRDSSVWGSYGDRHTAVCLKFRSRQLNNRQCLRLRRLSGWSSSGPMHGDVDHEFHKVTYGDDHLPIDFFRSLGRLPIAELQDDWYSDQLGRRSTCGDDIFENEDEWRRRYWEGFHHAVTRKLRDWHYEKEHRLLLSGELLDFKPGTSRIVTYDFADLEGLIFGINTPIDKKIEICKIIEEKCRVNKRLDFKFYQAFYCRSRGSIEHQEMSLLRFNLSEAGPSDTGIVG